MRLIGITYVSCAKINLPFLQIKVLRRMLGRVDKPNSPREQHVGKETIIGAVKERLNSTARKSICF